MPEENPNEVFEAPKTNEISKNEEPTTNEQGEIKKDDSEQAEQEIALKKKHDELVNDKKMQEIEDANKINELRSKFTETGESAAVNFLNIPLEGKNEENLEDESYPIEDPRRWAKLIESESDSTIKQYFNNLGLTHNMLSEKENILDIGADRMDFAAFCLKEKINNNIVSLEPVLEINPGTGIMEAVKMRWGKDIYGQVQNKTVVGVMEQMPFKENSFDFIVDHAAMPGFNYSINEIEQMKEGINGAFDEIIRVLKPGGEARLFPLADESSNELREQWRPAVDKKLSEIVKQGKCKVFIENVLDPETGELMEFKRLILRKILLEQADTTKDLQQHLREYLGLKEGAVERIGLLKAKNLPKNYQPQREALHDERLDSVDIAVVPDDLWVKGSQPSESSAENQLILIKQSYFEAKENPDEIAWMIHELAHCQNFLDSESAEAYQKSMQTFAFDDLKTEYSYPNNPVEQHTFTKQFQYLKEQGKSRENVLAMLSKHYDKEDFPFFNRLLDSVYEE